MPLRRDFQPAFQVGSLGGTGNKKVKVKEKLAVGSFLYDHGLATNNYHVGHPQEMNHGTVGEDGLIVIAGGLCGAGLPVPHLAPWRN